MNTKEHEAKEHVDQLFKDEADRIKLIVDDVLKYQKAQKFLKDKSEFSTEDVERLRGNVREVIVDAAVDLFGSDKEMGIGGDGQFLAMVQKMTNGGIKIDVHESIAGIMIFPKAKAASAG